MVLKLVRHPPTCKIFSFNFYSAIETYSYVYVWFNICKGAAKTIHNETFKETIV